MQAMYATNEKNPRKIVLMVSPRCEKIQKHLLTITATETQRRPFQLALSRYHRYDLSTNVTTVLPTRPLKEKISSSLCPGRDENFSLRAFEPKSREQGQAERSRWPEGGEKLLAELLETSVPTMDAFAMYIDVS